ncbi:MAG: phage tail protein [Alteromonadaceae bacterium]|nr:MAG: phage tail protein [Alteromonadaceae bacterium]
MSEPFIAEIRIFAGNFAPKGWAFCNGQLLPISQNTALFSLIGTTYGGDGRTTTALPNLEGRSTMHPGRGPGLTQRRLGQNLGEETATLSEAQIPNHNHTLSGTATLGDKTMPSSATTLSNAFGGRVYNTTPQNLVPLAASALGSTGGDQTHPNMMPFITLNFIIALVGLYPSRG